jgi:hypothetical protein
MLAEDWARQNKAMNPSRYDAVKEHYTFLLVTLCHPVMILPSFPCKVSALLHKVF